MEMKLRKWSILTLAFMLVFTLTACGGGTAKESSTPSPSSEGPPSNNNGDSNQPSDSDEPQIEEGAELLIWDNEEQEGEWAKYVAEEFSKKYGIPVKYEMVKHTDAPGKLQTDGPAGLGADVFNAPHDHTGNLASAGLILENFYADEYKANNIDAAINAGTYDGKLFGYPISIETYALFYNKDLVSKVPETWDEMIEQAKAFNDFKNQKYGFMMLVGDFYFVHSLVAGYGGYVFGNNNTDPTDIGLNNEGALKAAQLLKRMKKEILPVASEDIQGDLKTSLFKEGKLMFNVDGPWALAGFEEVGLNVGVAPLPKLDNGQNPKSFSGVKSYYVNAYTKYPEAASLYAKFATSPEMLAKRYEMTGQIPTRKDMLEDDAIKNNPVASAFLNQAVHAVSMPNIPEMQPVWATMNPSLAAMWNSDDDPQKHLDAAVQQIKDAIKLMGGK